MTDLTRQRSCTGKHHYRTRATATAGLTWLISQGRRPANRLHAYKCEWCGGWHLGHKPGET